MDDVEGQAAVEIVGDLEAANAEAISFVESCSDEQWRAVVSGEDWSVAVVLHHVAAGHVLMTEWLGRARSGTAITTTAQAVDADNARHARDFADVSRQETAEALGRNGAALVTFIGTLGADDLARSIPFGPAEGMEFSARQLAEAAVRHCVGHLAHARQALLPGTA